VIGERFESFTRRGTKVELSFSRQHEGDDQLASAGPCLGETKQVAG